MVFYCQAKLASKTVLSVKKEMISLNCKISHSCRHIFALVFLRDFDKRHCQTCQIEILQTQSYNPKINIVRIQNEKPF